VFQNAADLTIPNLLSDTYSKDYLISKFSANSSNTFSSFPDVTKSIGISNIKLIEGNGIDGITNSFAAALWLIDIGI
jgi:hypothetical protein